MLLERNKDRSRVDLRPILDRVRHDFSVSKVADKAGVKLKKAGSEWVGLCPFHGEKSPSFTVYASDRRFCCFGCGAEGDVLDLTMRAYGVKLFDAVEMLDSGALAELKGQLPPAQPKPDRRPIANRIVQGSRHIEGTAAEVYLRRRGITIPLPHTLRFSRLEPPRGNNGLLAANGPDQMPCLVAIASDPAGELVGLQRTYLTEDGRKAASTDGKVKYSLGNVSGGAIQLGPPAETIVVTEGLEDGLSLFQTIGGTVWVAAGTKMLPQMLFPEITHTVIVAAQGDEPGERAAQAAADAFLSRGLAVRITRPEPPYKDWNDMLMGVVA